MAPPNPFTLALPLFFAPLIVGCADGTKDAADTDVTDTDDDTQVVDTDDADTDVADTDVADTDEDTDVTDTDVDFSACGDGTSAADVVCFDAPAAAPGEGTLVALAFGDWSGDGHTDIVSIKSSTVEYLAGDGAGGLASPASIDAVGPVAPFVDIDVGQLDNDTNLDLAIGSNFRADAIFGDGEGGVATSEVLRYGEGTIVDVTVAEIIGTNTSDDVIISDSCGYVLSTSGAQGEGVIGASDFVCPASYVGFAKISSTKTAAVGATGTSVTLWPIDTGEGVIAGEGVVATLPGTPLGMVVADFDGDGLDDVAVAVDTDQIAVLFSDGEGGWASQGADSYIPYSVGEHATAIAAGDLDGDGDTDLVVSISGDDVLTVLINDGTGTFTAVDLTLAAGTAPGRLATGDLNEDGVDDIAVLSSVGSNLVVLLSNP